MLKRLKDDPSTRHSCIALAFVPDEELGHGVPAGPRCLGAAYGYTIGAGPLGEFCCGTLNAAQVQVSTHGKAVHTGTARGLMIDASEALMEFCAIILPQEQPEYTGGMKDFTIWSVWKGPARRHTPPISYKTTSRAWWKTQGAQAEGSSARNLPVGEGSPDPYDPRPVPQAG